MTAPCAAFFFAATERKNPWTVHAARALSSSCIWVTDLTKCRICIAARVISATRINFRRDARRLVAFSFAATTRKNQRHFARSVAKKHDEKKVPAARTV